MDTEWEVIDVRLLLAEVEDPDLGIGDTTTEPRFRVRLVLAVPVTEIKIAVS